MTARPKTTLAGSISPFTGKRLNAQGQAITPLTLLDLTKIEITNTPLPTGRSVFAGKYDALFATVKPGQCLECPIADVSKLANAARKWTKSQAKPMIVRTACVLEGKPERGGVWLLLNEGGAK